MNFDEIDRVFSPGSLCLCVLRNRVISEDKISFGGISIVELSGDDTDYVHDREVELDRFDIVLFFDVIKI